ncbi:oxygenase MpaB family protein [Pseudonocardia xishanensis]|uniref:Oxygenase MpaB family protein n=1 Tax=Pseudonocardia xishanensis TaxID=630995 RepID=A0ABP8S0T8_9PSEU
MATSTPVRPAADHGLFGPDSVTWRVHLEPVTWVAGMRALLLQSLHPWVMRGTFQNSALFDPAKAWPRFERTVQFVGTRTFGSLAEVETAGARVRNLHRRLRAVDPDTGRRFPIDAPEGLLWVHCGEIDSYVDIARRAGVVTAAEADAYVAESVRAAEVVGLDPATVPASRAELAAYFVRMRPRLGITEETRIAVGGLLAPPAGPPAWTRAAISATATAALATLPRWARRMYGLPGLPTTDVAASAALGALRRATDLLPDPPAPPEIQEARRLVRRTR